MDSDERLEELNYRVMERLGMQVEDRQPSQAQILAARREAREAVEAIQAGEQCE